MNGLEVVNLSITYLRSGHLAAFSGPPSQEQCSPALLGEAQGDPRPAEICNSSY